MLLESLKQVNSYFPHASLERANLQGSIAFGRAALQLPEDVATASFGVGHQPGEDLLPLPFKGVFVGTPPAQHPFSPLLLLVQGLESCCGFGNTSCRGKQSCHTAFYGKGVDGGRRE
jgi:hypothetical protein